MDDYIRSCPVLVAEQHLSHLYMYDLKLTFAGFWFYSKTLGTTVCHILSWLIMTDFCMACLSIMCWWKSIVVTTPVNSVDELAFLWRRVQHAGTKEMIPNWCWSSCIQSQSERLSYRHNLPLNMHYMFMTRYRLSFGLEHVQWLGSAS